MTSGRQCSAPGRDARESAHWQPAQPQRRQQLSRAWPSGTQWRQGLHHGALLAGHSLWLRSCRTAARTKSQDRYAMPAPEWPVQRAEQCRLGPVTVSKGPEDSSTVQTEMPRGPETRDTPRPPGTLAGVQSSASRHSVSRVQQAGRADGGEAEGADQDVLIHLCLGCKGQAAQEGHNCESLHTAHVISRSDDARPMTRQAADQLAFIAARCM